MSLKFINYRFDWVWLRNNGSTSSSSSSSLSLSLSLFFFFYFCFLGLHLWHMEVPSLGVQLELQLPAYTTATTSDPNRIFNCTTAHGNTRSLIHWERPGIEPTTSWFLVRFISAVPWWEFQRVYLLPPPSPPPQLSLALILPPSFAAALSLNPSPQSGQFLPLPSTQFPSHRTSLVHFPQFLGPNYWHSSSPPPFLHLLCSYLFHLKLPL